MIVKVAIYCRVSTEHQTTENQRLILEEYASRQGWDFEVFEEVESTRKTRPVKYALLQMLRDKKFNTVLVLKLDRWARSTIELVSEVTELYNRGVLFIALRNNVDLSCATGRLQFNIFSAFAEFERDLIQQNTRDGLARARAEGKILGRPVGKRDSKPRRKSGYYLRHANNKG